MTNSLDDHTLGEELRAEVPAPGADYWNTIDARLANATGSHVGAGDASTIPESAETATTDSAATASEAIDIGTTNAHGRQTTTAAVTNLATKMRSWPVLAAAAALILVVVLLGARALGGNSETVDAGFASAQDQAKVALDDLPGPTQNLDHWNAVYGVWDCTLNDGAGDWVPAFQSTDDDVGIHSHGDGLISIHPFFEESAGRNATFSHFADSMNFEVTNTTITLDDGRVLAAGASCGGEPAVIQMLRWQDAPALEADPTVAPRVITADFNAERFYNDLEVWTLALAPLDAAIPPPPAERFDAIAGWVLPSDVLEIRPRYDAYTSVRLAGTGSGVDDIITQMLSWTPEEQSLPGTLIPGTGSQLVAESRDARTTVHMATFEATISDNMIDTAIGDGDDPNAPDQWSCQVIALPAEEALQSARCGPTSEVRSEDTRIDVDVHVPTHTAIELWNADPDAAWLVVELESGERALANVVDGVSYAAWPNPDDLWTRIEVLDLDLEVVYVETCRLPTTMFCARS